MSKAMNEKVKAVVDRIERDKDYLIDLTRRPIRIPTVNPKLRKNAEINREPELQEALRKEFDGLGMATETIEVFPGRPKSHRNARRLRGAQPHPERPCRRRAGRR